MDDLTRDTSVMPSISSCSSLATPTKSLLSPNRNNRLVQAIKNTVPARKVDWQLRNKVPLDGIDPSDSSTPPKLQLKESNLDENCPTTDATVSTSSSHNHDGGSAETLAPPPLPPKTYKLKL